MTLSLLCVFTMLIARSAEEGGRNESLSVFKNVCRSDY